MLQKIAHVSATPHRLQNSFLFQFLLIFTTPYRATVVRRILKNLFYSWAHLLAYLMPHVRFARLYVYGVGRRNFGKISFDLSCCTSNSFTAFCWFYFQSCGRTSNSFTAFCWYHFVGMVIVTGSSVLYSYFVQ